VKILIEFALFWAGALLSIFWFSVTILPIFYGLPRSLYWIAKGRLKSFACLFYVGSFLFWFVLFTLAAYASMKFFPEAVLYLYNSFGFFCGQWLGIIVMLIKTLSPSGRKDLNDDFQSAMKRFRKGSENIEISENIQAPSDMSPMDLLKASLIESGEMTREVAERLITTALIQDLSSLSSRDIQIVGEYGRILTVGPGPLRPLSSLPYPKEVIKQSITTLLAKAQDLETRRSLKIALFALDDFIPDEEVPKYPQENKRKWAMLRFGYDTSQQNIRGTI
jgi:hypothetical protein